MRPCLLVLLWLWLCCAVALAFNEQCVEAVPMDAHDRHVDVLATDGGLLLCTDRARTHSQHGAE